MGYHPEGEGYHHLRDVLGERREECEREQPRGGEAVVLGVAPRDQLEHLEVGERQHEHAAVEAGVARELGRVDELLVALHDEQQRHGREQERRDDEAERQQPQQRRPAVADGVAREDDVGREVARADEDAPGWSNAVKMATWAASGPPGGV